MPNPNYEFDTAANMSINSEVVTDSKRLTTKEDQRRGEQSFTSDKSRDSMVYESAFKHDQVGDDEDNDFINP